jgi:hypothetical protein
MDAVAETIQTVLSTSFILSFCYSIHCEWNIEKNLNEKGTEKMKADKEATGFFSMPVVSPTSEEFLTDKGRRIKRKASF